MKKFLFDEIKKSLKNPSPPNEIKPAIHVKKIKSKNSPLLTYYPQCNIQKNSELEGEMLEYYKMQQNDEQEQIEQIPIEFQSYTKLQKSDGFSLNHKTNSTAFVYLEPLITTQVGQINDDDLQISQYQEQFCKTFNTPKTQKMNQQDNLIDSSYIKNVEKEKKGRKQIFIRRREIKKHLNENIQALTSKNSFQDQQKRLRTESIGGISTGVVCQSIFGQKNNIRASTQQGERDDDNIFFPTFENSILASNFKNTILKAQKNKQNMKSQEVSPSKKTYSQFLKSSYKKNQLNSQLQQSSYDYSSIKCFSQEYIQKKENPPKIQQQLEEKPLPFKIVHERQMRLSQTDMQKWKDTEISFSECMKTTKLCRQSTQIDSQISDIILQDSSPTIKYSRARSSMTPEKLRSETQQTKRMSSRNSKFLNSSMLSKQSSIFDNNMNHSFFNQSQEFNINDFAETSYLMNQPKNRCQSVHINNTLGFTQPINKQSNQQFVINISKKYEPLQQRELFENQLQNQQIIQNKHLKINQKSFQNQISKVTPYHLMDINRNPNLLQNLHVNLIKL